MRASKTNSIAKKVREKNKIEDLCNTLYKFIKERDKLNLILGNQGET